LLNLANKSRNRTTLLLLNVIKTSDVAKNGEENQ